MKIKRFLIGLLIISAACSTNTKETPKGYKFTLVKEGTGNPAEPGQFLMIDMVFKDDNDSVWNDSRNQEIPMILAINEPETTDEGFVEVLAMLRKGDSVTFSIPAKVLFEKTWRQPVPEEVDASSSFSFNIGVKDILDESRMRVLEQELMTKLSSAQLSKDIEQIDAHLAEANIEAQTTSSGLRYQITKQGSGKNAVQGSQVSIHYAGYLLDGTLFDTSMESVSRANGAYTPGRPYEPLTLAAGTGQVIRGWEEVILLMNKGSKMRVWIPSTLAYGPQRRSEIIKENSILVFDMEMMDIK